MPKYVIFVALFSILLSCRPGTKEPMESEGLLPLDVKYAAGFRLYEDGEDLVLDITRPYPEAREAIRYRLSTSEREDAEIRTILVPVKRLVCTSTTHLPMLDYLGMADRLVAFPNVDYISTPSIRSMVDAGDVAELGSMTDLNMENLLQVTPDLVMSFSMDNLKLMDRIEKAGLHVVLNGDYLEDHPLGRAEWIKVFGALLGEYERADSVFRMVESAYLEISEQVDKNQDRPCAFSGSLYGDSWYMPGGKNYAATLLNNAGFRYVLESDSTNGFLRWGFENTFDTARDCAYWISPAPFTDLEDLGNADERYREFQAWQQGNVYVYDKRIGPTGGNEYLELGYLRPDIILKDLAMIRNPSLFPGEELYFYRKLY